MITINSLEYPLLKYKELPSNDFTIYNFPRVLFSKECVFTPYDVNMVLTYTIQLVNTAYNLMRNEIAFFIYSNEGFIEIQPALIFGCKEDSFFNLFTAEKITYDNLSHKLFRYKGHYFVCSEKFPHQATTEVYVICRSVADASRYIPSLKYIGNIYFVHVYENLFTVFKRRYIGPLL